MLHLRLGFHGAQPHELAVLIELARMLLAPRGTAAFQSVVRVLLLPRHLTGMPALAQVCVWGGRMGGYVLLLSLPVYTCLHSTPHPPSCRS